MNKILPLAGVVALALAVWLILMGGQKVGNLPADGWQQYEGAAFTVSIPSGYNVNEAYGHTISPDVAARGVAFTVAASMATGTNLGSDTRISVETIPTLSACNATAYLDGINHAYTVVEDGKTYSVASSTSAGAGNFYEEIVYVRTDNAGPCPAVRYVLHNTVLANYPAGSVVEFDREALIEEFDKIRLSLETK